MKQKNAIKLILLTLCLVNIISFVTASTSRSQTGSSTDGGYVLYDPIDPIDPIVTDPPTLYNPIEIGPIDIEPIEFGVDFSDSPHFPVIDNQGSQGSCAAWAAIYYNYGYLEAKDNNWNAASGDPRYLLSPAWIYNKDHNPGNGGNFATWIANDLITYGCATMDTMPYNDEDDTDYGNEDAWRESVLHRAKAIHTGDFSAEEVIEILEQGHPVGFSLDADPIYSAGGEIVPYGFRDGNYIISEQEVVEADIIEQELGRPVGYHAQTIIGYHPFVYDDGDQGAFKVANSWGTDWGDNGFYWITYDAFERVWALSQDYWIEDIIDHHPQLIATVEFYADDLPSQDLSIEFGIGTPDDPVDSIWTGTIINNDEEYVSEFMCFDITALKDDYLLGNRHFYAELSDTDIRGRIKSFKVEMYGLTYEPDGDPLYSASSGIINEQNPCTVSVNLRQQDPIYIFSDSDWRSYVQKGLVTGFGKSYDPYIIENMVYNRGTIYPIYIADTDKHYKIENVEITGFDSWMYGGGIVIDNADNGDIYTCNIHHNTFGISIRDSQSMVVYGCTVKNNDNYGIKFRNIENAIILACEIGYNGDYGVMVK